VRGLQQALRPAAGEAGLPAQFQRRYKTYFRRELRAFPRIDSE
jgi:hypothetical protein